MTDNNIKLIFKDLHKYVNRKIKGNTMLTEINALLSTHYTDQINIEIDNQTSLSRYFLHKLIYNYTTKTCTEFISKKMLSTDIKKMLLKNNQIIYFPSIKDLYEFVSDVIKSIKIDEKYKLIAVNILKYYQLILKSNSKYINIFRNIANPTPIFIVTDLLYDFYDSYEPLLITIQNAFDISEKKDRFGNIREIDTLTDQTDFIYSIFYT